jgi:hypothetical protein
VHRPGETIARYVERLKLARHCSRIMGHSRSGSRTGSTPFPQLLPGLDECLHLSGTRKTVVNQPAILIRLLVQITNRRHAEVREAVTEFFEVLLAQNLHLLAIRRARHEEGDFIMFAICSPTTVPCAQRFRNFCCGERAAVTKDAEGNDGNGLSNDEAIGEEYFPSPCQG